MLVIETKDGVIEDQGNQGLKELLNSIADDAATDIMESKLNNQPWSPPTITDIWYHGRQERHFPRVIPFAQAFLENALEADLYLLEGEAAYREECHQYAYM